MDTHKRVLGILFTVTGILQIMVFTILSLIFSTLFPLIIEQADQDAVWILQWVSRFGQLLGILLIFFFAIPSVIAGIGLLNKQRWAMTLALILGCFKLFSFPIGTAIGIYTIWVFAEDQKQVKTT
ncbi:MAG TPA: hypothetical protein VIT44_14525 [Cyclobacteriaceae bacterium]